MVIGMDFGWFEGWCWDMWGWQCVGGWHCGGMVANVSYCGCCVCFFWVLLVAAVVVWLSGFFFSIVVGAYR